MKHLLVCLLALLAIPAAATTTSKTVTITITAPAGICSAPPPAPAVAAGLTTQVLCSDWTQQMPTNWLGGCSVAGNGAGNNTNDSSGHNWYLNIWWSFTLQNCNTVQRADPAFGGIVLDMPWQPNSNEQQIGTVIQSSAWHSTDLTDTNQGFTFPNNTYYEITMRQTPLTQGSYAALFTWPVLAMTDSTNQSGLEIDDIEEDAGNLQNSDGALHNWGVSGVPGQWLWQGYCGTGAVPQRLPCNFDPNQYHTFGALSTSDGTTQSTCSYIDGVFQQCVPIPGGLTATEASARYFLIVQNACDWWNYPSNFCNGPKQDMYVKDVKAWSCPSWQTTQCIKPPPPTTINATDFCAANGGGNGSAGNPWKAACIQAAVNAASSGNTVFLAAGNWGLATSGSQVSINKAINLIGAGSGNTFDIWGHVNNASGADFCPTASSNITCVYGTGTSFQYGNCPGFPNCGGTIIVGRQAGDLSTTCPQNISHIFFDGSLVTAGGDEAALLLVRQCAGPITISDLRFLAWNNIALTDFETQFWPLATENIVIRDSMFAAAQSGIVGGTYQSPQMFQSNGASPFGQNITIQNNVFYQNDFNPIYLSRMTFVGNATYQYNDGLGTVGFDPGAAWAGGGMGGPAVNFCNEESPASGQCNGNYTYNITNNVYYATGNIFGLGGGVNDPSTSGGINDFHITGNWVIAGTPTISACQWRFFNDQGNCADNGMTINTAVDTSCNESDNGTPFAITNNSLIGTSAAILDAQATGSLVVDGSGTFGGCLLDGAGSSRINIPIRVYGFNAQKNYLKSPSNQYTKNAASINPTQTGNFCSGGVGTVTGCATSGFTQAPTVSFTLGPLTNDPVQGAIVPFTSTNFTAQYGAVQWLASTSSTTPTAADSRWSSNNASFPNSAPNSYIPPVSLAGVSHGSTVFMWVMDSANHISAPASAVVP